MENQNKLQKTNSTDDIVRMGKVFFESKMFNDLTNMAQAIVKVQAGAELGIPPFQAISGVHIIKGKAVIGAGIMASMVDRHPEYDFEVLQQNDDVCEIKFFKNGKVRGTSKFTADDAKRAGTQNMGKFPANMLYARAMSNGVKWYAPGVFAGPVYVPEEMEEPKTEETTYTEVKAIAEPQEQVIESKEEPASEEQKEFIRKLLQSHHIPTSYRDEVKALEEDSEGLTKVDAHIIIEELEGMIAKGTNYEASTPATEEQLQQILQLLDDDVISPDEAEKGQAKIAKGYSIAQAHRYIKNLQKLIEERKIAIEHE